MPSRSARINGHELTFNVRPDRIDLRDLPFRPQLDCLPAQYPADEHIAERLPAYLEAKLILDQGKEGACTGFGLAATINYLLWVRSGMTMDNDVRVSPRMLYHLARFYDEWPGEGYEGSSCRGALKGWHKHGVCAEKYWPYVAAEEEGRAQPGWDIDAVSRPLGVYYRIDRESVVDMQAAIYQTGAIYVSCRVHKGWSVKSADPPTSPGKLPVIAMDSEILGGHAFALIGYNDIGFIVQNSWGTKWGASGFAILPYDDWVRHGSDAWVMGLGVPLRRPVHGGGPPDAVKSPMHFIKSKSAHAAGPTATDWFGRQDLLADMPEAWPEGEAYTHAVVSGNDGTLLNRLVQMPNPRAAAEHVCRHLPLEHFKRSGGPPRVAIYAHGGLHDETYSITHIRTAGRYFKDNGIYPIFVTWKSGWAETLAHMLADRSEKELGAAFPARGIADVLNEAWDRAIEVLARSLLARSMWTEMKENVEEGANDGRGLSVIADSLAALRADFNGDLEIHLIGHSAGSLVCGRLLSEFRKHAAGGAHAANMKVGSCTLYAPACDLDFALDHFKPAIEDRVLAHDALHVHVLSDARELNDTVGPYTKSLLYLVSRALERRHKTPLLGLASAFDGARATQEYWHESTVDTVKAWQRFFWQQDPPKNFAKKGGLNAESRLYLLNANQVDTGPCKIKSTHGSFDNSVDILEHTLCSILGLADADDLNMRVKSLYYAS